MAHRINRHQAIGRVVGASLVLCTLSVASRESHAQQKAAPASPAAASPSTSPSVPRLSGILPVVVDIPSGVTTPEQARPFFDDFSWRTFIALNWPAAPGKRGVPKSPNDPNVFLNAGKSYQTVWGTYREAYELYRVDDAAPATFASARRRTRCADRARLDQDPSDGGEVGDAAAGHRPGVLVSAGRSEQQLRLLRDPLQRDQYEFVRRNDRALISPRT